MKLLGRLFSNSGFRGPVLTLLSGTGVVMIIAFLAKPIITRLYLPEELGIAETFLAITSVIAAIASLRYEDALMLPKKDEDAAVLVWVSMLALGCTAALTILAAIWRFEIANFIQMPLVAPYLPLVPVALLLMRTGKIAEYWLVRKRAFRQVSAIHITLTSAMTGSRVGLGAPPISANEAGLIGGYVTGHLFATAAIIGLVSRRYYRTLMNACRWHRIKAAAKRYRRFALFSTPAATILTLVARMPSLLIPVFILQSEAELGLYSTAFAAVSIPMAFISRSIAHPFFVSAAEARLEGSLVNVTSMVHRRLIMVIMFPLLALLMGGPDCFEFVYGDNFRQSGLYVRSIGGWLFLSAVVSPLTRVFDVTENQRLDFGLGLLTLVALTAALILGGSTGNMMTLLLATGLTGLAVRLVQLFTILYLARVPVLTSLRAYWDFLLLSLPGLGIVGLALLWQQPWITTVGMVCGGVIYVILAVWREKLYKF